MHDQVIISTGQDWNLRRLHRADPELALGFDPGHYFDYAIESDIFFLPRTMGELYRHLRDFFIIEIDGKVVACGALEIFTEDLGEVRSLVVDEAYERRGLGRMMVERVIQEARTIGLKRLMALTYVPTFFHKLGFETVAMDTLPEKVWGICVKCYKYNNCDETAVVLELK